MKIKLNQQQIQHITKLALILCLIAIIVQLFPSRNRFNYQFEIGKPWSYQLITAGFDFPIYKNSEQISKEQIAILKDFHPYFESDSTVAERQFQKLISNSHASINKKTSDNLHNKLKHIYAVGIISGEEEQRLKRENQPFISCIQSNRLTKILAVTDLYTPRKAYEELLSGAPSELRKLDLNLYLTENLRFDKSKTELARKDLLKNQSLTQGMVQAGQRIIDRGEIVTPVTYQELNSLKIEMTKRQSTIHKSSIVIVGEAIMILCLVSLFFLYIYLFRPRIYERFSDLLFMSLLIVTIVGLTAFCIRYSFNYYMVPFALIPIIVRVFYDARTALFAHIITVLIVSFIVNDSFQFLVIQIAVGMAAVSSLKDITQRSQLAQTALYIFLCYSLVYLSFQFIAEGDINRINWEELFYFGISSFILLLGYILIYIFEKLFGLISSITLVELTNINNDLMLRFAELAPGTFQHSLQVSNLATEAAKKINANSLLVRTGALYHDIGKMNHPEFYTENQQGGYNPLMEMDFEKAAQTVINHVRDGISIAKKNRLPEQIINFIGTHHGYCKTRFFYNSFINANPGVKPNDAIFTYPGPLPNNKETAILMMADAVEARSRSMKEYTEEAIDEMVEQIVNGQIADGQFRDAPITFRDVETVKQVFKTKIKNIYHTRIAYPEVGQAIS